MRRLTFKGFLRRYLQELSLENTSSVHKLLIEAESNNARLFEPLLIYIALSFDNDRLNSILKKSETLNDEYSRYFKTVLRENLEEYLSNSNDVPKEYTKIYRSYLSVRNRVESDNDTKARMRTKILKLIEDKGYSDYRVYKKLKINPGNYSAFFKQGKLDRLSLDKTREVLSFVNH